MKEKYTNMNEFLDCINEIQETYISMNKNLFESKKWQKENTANIRKKNKTKSEARIHHPRVHTYSGEDRFTYCETLLSIASNYRLDFSPCPGCHEREPGLTHLLSACSYKYLTSNNHRTTHPQHDIVINKVREFGRVRYNPAPRRISKILIYRSEKN